MTQVAFLYDLKKVQSSHTSCLYKSYIPLVQDRFITMTFSKWHKQKDKRIHAK